MKAMSLRVGMDSELTRGARWLMAGAWWFLMMAPKPLDAQTVPILWSVEWTVEAHDSESLDEADWDAALSTALTLRPPQRVLGLPLQHAASRVLG